MLWVGVFLWIVGVVFPLVFPVPFDTVSEMFEVPDVGIGVMLLAVLCAALEEGIFRGWTLQKKGFTWFTIVAMAFYCGVCVKSVMLGLVAALVLSLIVVLPFLAKYRTCLLLLSTSLLFALSHLGRYPIFSLAVTVPIVGDLGFGLLMGYVAINYSLLRSILFHCCLNFVAVCMCIVGTFVLETFPNTIILENDRWQCEAVVEYQNPGWQFEASDSTIHCHAIMGGLVEKLMMDYYTGREVDIDHLPIIFQYPQYSVKNGRSYKFTIKNKHDTISWRDYRNLVQELEQMGLFHLDTTYPPMQILSIEDVQKVYDNEESSWTVKDVILELRNKFSIPVIPEEGMNVYYPVSQQCVFAICEAPSVDQCLSILETHGLKVTTNNHRKVQVITIKERTV